MAHSHPLAHMRNSGTLMLLLVSNLAEDEHEVL